MKANLDSYLKALSHIAARHHVKLSHDSVLSRKDEGRMVYNVVVDDDVRLPSSTCVVFVEEGIGVVTSEVILEKIGDRFGKTVGSIGPCSDGILAPNINAAARAFDAVLDLLGPQIRQVVSGWSEMKDAVNAAIRQAEELGYRVDRTSLGSKTHLHFHPPGDWQILSLIVEPYKVVLLSWGGGKEDHFAKGFPTSKWWRRVEDSVGAKISKGTFTEWLFDSREKMESGLPALIRAILLPVDK